MLKLRDLASRQDFDIGPLHVSPSRRLVAGPGGNISLEPIVMKVFLLLLDGGGSVVTRDELFGNAWGGVFVGDDSLNRAIARVRKIEAETAPGLFGIETIPRTGYRLSGDILAYLGEQDPVFSAQAGKRAFSRRALIGSASATIVVAGGAGAWLTARNRSDKRFDALIAKAEAAIRSEDANKDIIVALEEAVAIRPGSAKAWGLLAFFNSILAQLSGPTQTAALITRAQAAAERALSISPNESYALLAMFELEGSTLDWFARDQRLRRIIAVDPTNIWAIAEFVLMLQAAGMSRESWNWNERAIALVPLSLDFLSKRALKLWVAGRLSAADKVIDQVRALYPTNEWAWFVRFLILAMSDRAEAAQVMLNTRPEMIGDPIELRVWRAALPALIDASPAAIERARAACFEAAKVAGQTTGQDVVLLSALGDLDGAFAIADGSLVSRGSIIRAEKPGSKGPVQDAIDRINMQWIWIPPVAPMRADARFLSLCESVGLTEYWHRRGVKPDYQLAR
jgi:DNA-binding winged helix-turn-helix (wHTH) protein/tetratricopeptide (TPR) repeat protein